MSSKFECAGLEVTARQLCKMTTDGNGAGEADFANNFRCNQRLGDYAWIAVYDIENPSR